MVELSKYRYSLDAIVLVLYPKYSANSPLSQNLPISHIRTPGFIPQIPIVHSWVPVASVISSHVRVLPTDSTTGIRQKSVEKSLL